MRRILAAILIALCAACITGCALEAGSGNMLTDIRPAGDFAVIKAQGIQSLVIEQGSPACVKVTADDNVIESVITSSRDGCLLIENHSGRKGTDIKVNVTLPRLNILEIQGRIQAECPGPLDTDGLSLRIVGSGSVSMPRINCSGGVQVHAKGSGNAWISGSCASLKIRSEGAGSIFAEGMECPDISARLSGPGSVFVTASGTLQAQVEASGSLFYQGKPGMIKKVIRGTGSVSRR